MPVSQARVLALKIRLITEFLKMLLIYTVHIFVLVEK